MKIRQIIAAIAILLPFVVSTLVLNGAEARPAKRLIYIVNSDNSNKNDPSKQPRNSCSISGRLFGSGIQRDRSYYVIPSDPERDEPLSRMSRVDSSNPSYRLSSLPSGRYVLRVFRSESGSPLPVRTFPRQREVNCTGNPINNVDFEVE